MKLKTILFLFFFSISHFYLSAQFGKGVYFLGGDLNVQTFSTESTFNLVFSGGFEPITSENKSTSVDISPNIGFFVSSNLAIGTGFNYIYTATEAIFSQSTVINIESSETNSSQYIISPFVRYYTPFHEKAGFAFDLSFQYGFGKEENKTANTTPVSIDINRLGMNVTPTFYYFFTSKFALEVNVGGLSYFQIKREADDPLASINRPLEENAFRLTFGSSFSVGVRLYLGNLSSD